MFLFFLVSHILADHFLIQAYCIYTISMRPEMITPIRLLFQLRKWFKTRIAVRPLSTLIMSETDTFGGIFNTRWTWSSCTFNSSTLQPLIEQKTWMHFITSSFTLHFNILYLCFGTHTIWYWQCYITCDILINLLMVSTFLDTAGTVRVSIYHG